MLFLHFLLLLMSYFRQCLALFLWILYRDIILILFFFFETCFRSVSYPEVVRNSLQQQEAAEDQVKEIAHMVDIGYNAENDSYYTENAYKSDASESP